MKFYNGVYAVSENSAALKVFLALGFDYETAFSLSYDAALRISVL